MSYFDQLLAIALSMSPAAILALVFVSSWLEYVFPPYFGDSAILLGFFLAGQGAVPPVEVFIAAVLGGVLGAMVAFWLGERYGAAALAKISRRRSSEGVPARIRELLGRHGEAVLLVNRFIPFLRNFMIYGAGVFRLRFLPSMAANALSVLGFMSLLMALGLMAAGSFEELRASFQQIFGWAGLVAMAAVVAWVSFVSKRRPVTESPAD